MEWNSRGGNQRMSLQKCANFSGPICACATGTRIQPEYPVLFSMFSGEFCLRLKPYLVIKIAPDIPTEYCCQVCVLVMMFCRPDCRLCAGMCGKSGTSVPRVLTNSRRVNFTVQFGVLTCWHSGRPTWDMKNILYIWFSHFTLTETHLC